MFHVGHFRWAGVCWAMSDRKAGPRPALWALPPRLSRGRENREESGTTRQFPHTAGKQTPLQGSNLGGCQQWWINPGVELDRLVTAKGRQPQGNSKWRLDKLSCLYSVLQWDFGHLPAHRSSPEVSILTWDQPQAGKGSLYSWIKNKWCTNLASLTWKCAKCSHLAVTFDHRFKAYHFVLYEQAGSSPKEQKQVLWGSNVARLTQESYVLTSPTALWCLAQQPHLQVTQAWRKFALCFTGEGPHCSLQGSCWLKYGPWSPLRVEE